MQGNALDRESILTLINSTPSLLEEYCDLSIQLQPNGFDLTICKINSFNSSGQVDMTNEQRIISDITNLPFDQDDYIELDPGPYLITFNEVIRLPLDIMALAKSRSSLLRCGVAVHTAVWDAGYHGRSQALIVVYNSQGFRVKRNARLIQLVFMRLSRPLKEGYEGIFKGENIS